MSLFNINAFLSVHNISAQDAESATCSIYVANEVSFAPLFGDKDFIRTVANPVRANETGIFDLIYMVEGTYRLELRDRKGTLLLEVSDVSAYSSESGQFLRYYRTVADVLGDTVLSYTDAPGLLTVEPGHRMLETTGHFIYEVAAPDAADHKVTTAGGVKLYIMAGDVGCCNVRAFGALGDGVADDTAALQAALDSGARLIYLPAGSYRTTAPLQVDGELTLYGEGSNLDGSSIMPDPTVLEAVQIGARSIYTGTVRNVIVERASYDGGSENVGWALYNLVNSTFDTVTSRLSKRNWCFQPRAAERVAYSTFLNCGATGGFYNICGAPVGTGFVNEIVWLGGRFHTSADTASNVYIDWGANHWRFIGVSLEGSASEALYINDDTGTGGAANSILVQNCRFEGTWTSGSAVRLGANSKFCTIQQNDIYTTIEDLGSGNDAFTGSDGKKITSVTNLVSALKIDRTGLATDAPLLDLEDRYSSSGESYGIRYMATRGAGYMIRLFRSTTELFTISLLDASQAILTNLGRAVLRRTSSGRTDAVLKVQDEFASSGDSNVLQLRAGRGSGKAIEVVNHSSEAVQGGLNLIGNVVQFHSEGSGHGTPPLRFGDYRLWVDSTGALRIKDGAPSGDTDGNLV